MKFLRILIAAALITSHALSAMEMELESVLPEEIIEKIFQNLEFEGLLSVFLVSTKWNALICSLDDSFFAPFCEGLYKRRHQTWRHLAISIVKTKKSLDVPAWSRKEIEDALLDIEKLSKERTYSLIQAKDYAEIEKVLLRDLTAKIKSLDTIKEASPAQLATLYKAYYAFLDHFKNNADKIAMAAYRTAWLDVKRDDLDLFAAQHVINTAKTESHFIKAIKNMRSTIKCNKWKFIDNTLLRYSSFDPKAAEIIKAHIAQCIDPDRPNFDELPQNQPTKLTEKGLDAKPHYVLPEHYWIYEISHKLSIIYALYSLSSGEFVDTLFVMCFSGSTVEENNLPLTKDEVLNIITPEKP